MLILEQHEHDAARGLRPLARDDEPRDGDGEPWGSSSSSTLLAVPLRWGLRIASAWSLSVRPLVA